MILVKDIMTRDPEYFYPQDQVTKARSVMRDHHYRSFPVVKDARLVGIITRGDVMRVTSNKANILVEGIMTKNIEAASPEEDLFSCTHKMLKAGLRQMPVVAKDALVGIISASDILATFLENKYTPQKKNVLDIMTTGVLYCEPEDELLHIWDKMYASGLSGFPVVLKGKVVGMITRMDMIREGSMRVSKESGKGKTVHVKKAMKKPAVTISRDASTKDAAELMIKKKISRLPTTDEKDRLVGIVDVEDILRAYAG
jgi:CBS domain-containing protein